MQSKRWNLDVSDFEKIYFDNNANANSHSDSESASEPGGWSGYSYKSAPGFNETDFKKLAMAVRTLKRTQKMEIEFLLDL